MGGGPICGGCPMGGGQMGGPSPGGVGMPPGAIGREPPPRGWRNVVPLFDGEQRQADSLRLREDRDSPNPSRTVT